MQVIKFVYKNTQKIKAYMDGLSQAESISLRYAALAKNVLLISMNKIIYLKNKACGADVFNNLRIDVLKSISAKFQTGANSSVGLSAKKTIHSNKLTSVADINICDTKISIARPSQINVSESAIHIDSKIHSFMDVKHASLINSGVDTKLKSNVQFDPLYSHLYHEIHPVSYKNILETKSTLTVDNSVYASAKYYEGIYDGGVAMSASIDFTLNKFRKLKDCDVMTFAIMDNLMMEDLDILVVS